MDKALSILVNEKGNTIGAKLYINNQVKCFNTKTLSTLVNIHLENAVIDKNGFVRGKPNKAKLPREQYKQKYVNKACNYYDRIGNTHYCLINKKELQQCPNPCKYFSLVCALPSFLNHMDKLSVNASKIQKYKDFDDIIMHANSVYFINRNINGKEEIFTVEEMADMIKVLYANKPIPNFRLISCSAGALRNGLASNLAKLLGVKILAAIGTVAVDFDGNLTVIDPVTQQEIESTKAWVLFNP